MAAEIQIAREQPVRPDVRSLAAHGGERAEMMTEHDFLCLRQFFRGDAGLLHFIHNAQGQLLGCFAFFRIDSSIDAKQTRIARCVRECGYAKRQTGLFAHAPI